MTHTSRSRAILAVAALLMFPGCGRNDAANTLETGAAQAPPATQEADSPEQEPAAVGRGVESEDATPSDIGPGGSAEEDRPVALPVATPPASARTPVEVNVATSDTQANDGFVYVGVAKCKGCHLAQYKSWATTTMATSFDGLRPGVKTEAKTSAGLDPNKDYTHEESCLRCHTTGFGKPGGFVDLETTPKMANVQCEACHGPGEAYGRLMKENKEYSIADAVAAGLVIPSAGPEGCLHCHGSDNPFKESVNPAYAFHFEQGLEQSHDHVPMKRTH